MLSLKDIKLAINEKLLSEFPKIEIQSTDIKEGFKRPSFFVKFDYSSKTDYRFVFERRLTVRIYYFPSDRYQYDIEVIEMQEDIEKLFYLGLQVKDRYLKIENDIQSELVDGVLIVSFDLSYYDSSYTEPEQEKMEELEYNG